MGKGKDASNYYSDSFILMTLNKIFKCFITPSHGRYNWVDAPQKEKLFMNDLYYQIDGEK